MKSALSKVKQALLANTKAKNISSYVPNLWLLNRLPLTDLVEIKVNLANELIQIIDDLEQLQDPNTLYNQPLQDHSQDWIKKATVYSMMIRTQTSWDHNHDGILQSDEVITETGTFLKTLFMLPLLQKMGINTLYLLPINQTSTLDKKGDFGSPYAVSNFFKLDETLKDSLTGDLTTVDDEFQALCEACHTLGIRITLDFVPRTNAIDSDFIIDHPDWFYWIDKDEANNYIVPQVPELFNDVEPISKPTNENLPVIYREPKVIEHIKRFRLDPRTTNKKLWDKFVKDYHATPNMKMLSEIEKRFNVTVAKAFSDGVNDNQPPWSDITFFRMYLDNPTTSSQYAPHDAAPYILFDIIKANMHKGNKPNKELWDTLANIAPYFQKHFGIDGARIDMGHALPSELVNLIITNARQVDPNFCFIAEELEAENAQAAFDAGYDIIIGNSFKTLPRMPKAYKYDDYNINAGLAVPYFACTETHDTPRIAGRFSPNSKGVAMSRLISVMNIMTPNGIPFINSGQELLEVQPINTGLDSQSGDEFKYLDTTDPYFGKLALFDKYAFHWLSDGIIDNIKLYEQLDSIRKSFINTLSNPHNYEYSHLDFLPDHFIRICFNIVHEEQKDGFNQILFVANVSDFDTKTYYELGINESKMLISTKFPYETHANYDEIGMKMIVNPLEAQIYLLKK